MDASWFHAVDAELDEGNNLHIFEEEDEEAETDR